MEVGSVGCLPHTRTLTQPITYHCCSNSYHLWSAHCNTYLGCVIGIQTDTILNLPLKNWTSKKSSHLPAWMTELRFKHGSSALFPLFCDTLERTKQGSRRGGVVDSERDGWVPGCWVDLVLLRKWSWVRIWDSACGLSSQLLLNRLRGKCSSVRLMILTMMQWECWLLRSPEWLLLSLPTSRSVQQIISQITPRTGQKSTCHVMWLQRVGWTHLSFSWSKASWEYLLAVPERFRFFRTGDANHLPRVLEP